VEGLRVKEKANKIALKMRIECQSSSDLLEQFKKQCNATQYLVSGQVSAEASEKHNQF
jgi:hypothetical protein